MKRIILPFLFLTTLSFGQKAHEIVVSSEIKQIKLFLTSGEMTHKSEVKLLKGRNKIIFSGISAYADPQSIQFTNSIDYKLVSFSTEMDFLAAEQFNPKIVKLKDSLSILKDALQLNADINSSFQAELAVLNTNKDLKGNNQNITVAQIKEAGEFYRIRTLEINKQVSKLNKEHYLLLDKMELVRFQLTELNFNENQRSNQVIVLVDVEQNATASCGLSYLVSDCGWVATYDLSTGDVNQKINLKYKAKIYNNTGNDWNNVDLVLSTADPKLSASQPNLSPWILDYYAGNYGKMSNSISIQKVQQDYRQEVEENLNEANQRSYDNWMMDEQASGNAKFSRNQDVSKFESLKNGKKALEMEQIDISELTAEFVIPSKFSCPTDGKPYVVDVKDMNLDATFSYVTVPKLDNGAFLLANIVGWQDLDLMPGLTNVYFGGVYVGVSNIDTRNVSDTLSLSFGRDAKVVVMRKLKSEMSSKKVVGSTKREAFVYDIALRNNRSTPITIDVFDQIPLSKNSEISVSTDNISNGKKDVETGEVKWEITLQPGETKNVEIGYTVKYPKDAAVVLQKYRTVTRAKF
ncbi:MAG: DUF4139 domain-containing protein [Bacteroidota bacterium]